ncbi:MAG: YidC/Oxa1 family membrane protein insertase [Planctomycetaceae bacterium]
MFPISKKQVANVQKMKDINPKLQEIKTKYAGDKEAMTRAQLELMRKHGYNPVAGCLPLILQLPIFIGLYNALNNAVDLRMAKFLWIDNLAAPDNLFDLPFNLPFLGSQFNLLPLITIVLFIIQNKLFTPPPTNEEQALQQKMMNFMMIFFGVMFYHVPAGLCVYFIASSLWGICERKLLDRHRKTLEAAGGCSTCKKEPATPKRTGRRIRRKTQSNPVSSLACWRRPTPRSSSRTAKVPVAIAVRSRRPVSSTRPCPATAGTPLTRLPSPQPLFRRLE